jgi:hypothetical protein
LNLNKKGQKWFRKTIIIVIAMQLAYLVLINGVLLLPQTQTLVNMARPDKFQVSWDRAWSWYPFRVHVEGLSANGQSRSQQWQLDARTARATVAVVPLLFKHARISDVLVTDIQYRQRPRLRSDKDFTRIMAFFPAIDGREMTPAITTPRKKKKPWHITLDNIRATGSHSVWILQAQGKAEGELVVDLSFQTQGGPFSLIGRRVDLQLDKLYLNGKEEVLSRGEVNGEMAFSPFVPADNKGAALLEFLSLDVEVDVDLNSLAFLNLFLLNLDGVAVDGVGQVGGHLRYHAGNVLSGTNLSVTAQDLAVDILSHRIVGTGAVDLNLGPQTQEKFDLTFRYDGLQVHRIGENRPLLEGQGLQLSIGGNGRVLVDPEQLNTSRSVTLEVNDLSVPDLALMQHYLPGEWPLSFYGGSGSLDTKASISPTALSIDLALVSDGADLSIKDYRFDTNVDLALKINNPAVYSENTDVSGSYITLSDAHLHRADRTTAESWDATIIINNGQFRLREQQPDSEGHAIDMLQGMGHADSGRLLESSSAVLDFSARVSNLAWIGVLFEDEYGLGVGGSGAVDGVVHMASGELAPGTKASVTSDDLAVDVLDYTSHGDGLITLQVKEGEAHPDWFIDIGLMNADFKRESEEHAYIENVELSLAAVTPNVRAGEKNKASELDFKITAATVNDLSTFNDYLPPGSSLRLTGGTGELTADIALRKDDADGWLKLESKGLAATVGEQSISADLAVDVLLVGGTPGDMMFDISGSGLRLDNVRVRGEETGFSGDYWSAVFELERGKTTWIKPVEMDLEAKLSISDSRPLVAVFENQGRRPEFISRMLTVKDIEGSAALRIADKQLHILDARVIGDTLEVAAKGTISSEHRNAVLYMRYKKADALLKFKDGKKNLDIIGVKKKFADFEE